MKNQTTVKALAELIATIEPRNHSEIALLGLMTGVLYSLDLAIELGFDDARTKRGIDDEKTEIHHALDAIRRDLALADAWLAGFYLDSAIMRLDTFYERISKYARVKCILAHEVHCVNKAIKHRTHAGLKEGWNIRFADVVRSTKALCELLEKVLSEPVSDGVDRQ